MAHSPSCDGAVYGCSTCQAPRMTIEELHRHRDVCPHGYVRCKVAADTGRRTRGGRVIRSLCTLQADHDGDHAPYVG